MSSDLMIRIERGRSRLLVAASAAGQEAALGSDDSAAPGLSVEVTFSGGPDGVWFRLVEAGRVRVFPREQVEEDRALSAVLRLIGDEVELSRAPSEALLTLLFRSLLVYVSRQGLSVPLPRWGRPLRDRRIERALELLDADLSKYWTVELLARAVGLSRPVFARQFVRMLRLSPMRYLARRRMQEAARLLRESEASVAEISVRLGYASEFAFGRAFKRHHRVPPGTFRRQPFATRACALARAA